MSNFYFLGHAGYDGYLRDRIASVERVSSYARQAMRRTNAQKMAHLETELAILSIANRAMFELLTEKGLATQEEIEAKMKQLADRLAEGDVAATPEALAKDLQIKVVEDEKKEKLSRNLDRMAQERLRRYGRREGE